MSAYNGLTFSRKPREPKIRKFESPLRAVWRLQRFCWAALSRLTQVNAKILAETNLCNFARKRNDVRDISFTVVGSKPPTPDQLNGMEIAKIGPPRIKIGTITTDKASLRAVFP